MCSHCLRASCDFFYEGLGGNPGINPYRDCAEDCTEMRAMSCADCRAVSAASARKSYGDRASDRHWASQRLPHCKNCAMPPTTWSTGYGLIDLFQICKTVSLNQIDRGRLIARLNPYDWLIDWPPPASAGRPRVDWPHGKRATGRIRAP